MPPGSFPTGPPPIPETRAESRKTLPPPPTTPEARQAVLAAAVFAAVAVSEAPLAERAEHTQDDELPDGDLADEDDEGSDPFLEGGAPPTDFPKGVQDVYQAPVAGRALGLAEFDAERVAEAVVERREQADDFDPDDG